METTLSVSIWSIVLFLSILGLLLFLRSRFGEKVEVRNPDIVLALTPIMIWMLLSGKLTSVEFGDLKLETAFKEAKNEPIADQVSVLPISKIGTVSKGGVMEVKKHLLSKPEALKFTLNNWNYDPHVMEYYFQEFSSIGSVQHIIIAEQDGRFVGMINFNELSSMIFGERSSLDVNQFISWLKDADRESLLDLPGMINASTAVMSNSSKFEALQKMEEHNTSVIPVLEEGILQGVVDRSRLTASLLLDVSRRIENGNE